MICFVSHFVSQPCVLAREHPIEILDAAAADRRKHELLPEDQIDLQRTFH